jgi:hypothetical protein
VFSISIYHTYFNNQIDTITLIPKDATKQLFHSYGLKLIKDKHSFQFYDQSDNGFSHLLTHINESAGIDAFKFDLINTDSSFFNYTDLPINFMGNLIYSSTNTSNKIENDTVTLEPKFEENSNPLKLGEVHLKFSDLKSDNPANFEIKFKTRSTYWKYYIINNTQVNINNLSIFSHSDLEFDAPIYTTIKQKEAIVIKSKMMIPLNHHSAIDLVNTEKQQKMVLTKLPTPSPNDIIISKNEGKSMVYSPMYIYL